MDGIHGATTSKRQLPQTPEDLRKRLTKQTSIHWPIMEKAKKETTSPSSEYMKTSLAVESVRYTQLYNGKWCIEPGPT